MFAFFWVLLVVVLAIDTSPAVYSQFELKRRAKHSERWSYVLDKQAVLPALAVVRELLAIALLVALTVSLYYNYGWALGLLLSFVLAVLARYLASLKIFNKISEKLYRPLEPKVNNLLRKIKIPADNTEKYHRIDSAEELQCLIHKTDDKIFTRRERDIIGRASNLKNLLATDIMTPARAIKTVNRTEFLGPLVLDELHRYRHRYLPVIDGDIDHVIGILTLDGLLSLDTKRSVPAEKAMSKHLTYADTDDDFETLLGKILKSRQQLLIIVDGDQKTAGLITMRDLLTAVIGEIDG